eukprot:scaffold35472_cov31-Tisochrysis_lutea.AAC.9
MAAERGQWKGSGAQTRRMNAPWYEMVCGSMAREEQRSPLSHPWVVTWLAWPAAREANSLCFVDEDPSVAVGRGRLNKEPAETWRSDTGEGNQITCPVCCC